MTPLEEFYRCSYKNKVNFVRKMVRGDYELAEDIVQETFTKALANVEKYNSKKGTINTWFNSILNRVVVDYKRNNKIKTVNIYHLTDEDLLEAGFVDGELKSFLSGKIQSVENSKHRAVLRLFFILGYRAREIEEMTGGRVKTKNVGIITMRFRNQLKEEL